MISLRILTRAVHMLLSTDTLVSPYNIINDNSEKVNPVKMIVPAQILQSLEESNQPSFLLEGSVEMNVDKNGNQIFTPQEIGEMTSDEFYKKPSDYRAAVKRWFNKAAGTSG